MYALNDRYDQSTVTGVVSNFVLRHARRLVRSVGFFLSRDLRVPRFTGVVALAGFFSAVSIYGILAGGHSFQVSQSVASGLGFSVESVNVSGNKYMSDIDVVSALGLDGNTSTLGFDVVAARKALSVLPWIQSVDVQKIYPGRVIVSVVERQPFAIWQHDGRFDVIDRDGRVIVPYTKRDFASLPQVVGKGAAVSAAAFVAQLAQYPEIAKQVRAYVRMGDRRWDLVLMNGVRIKLPEYDVNRRLAELVKVNREDGLFERDITEVDMRLDDRITVALTPSALEHYNQKTEETNRLLRAKKGGRA